LSIRLKGNAGADWKGAMREALLGFQVANQFAATAFTELSLRQRNVSWGEICGNVSGCGFFADSEDLGMRRREG
jgi:hypothetical protein